MFRSFLNLSKNSLSQHTISKIQSLSQNITPPIKQFSTKKGKATSPYQGKSSSSPKKSTEPSPYISRGTPQKPQKVQSQAPTSSPKQARQESRLSQLFQQDMELERMRVEQAKQAIKDESRVTIIARPENDEAINFKLDIPWNFEGGIEKRKEGNLKAPVGLTRLLNYKIAVGLFKDFAQALQEFDEERLDQLLERSFYERVVETLRKMKKKGYNFEIEGMSSKKNKVDLFNVTNLYCVGVETNRNLNDGASQYQIFDNFIDESPTRNIVKQRFVGNEKAVVKVVLDLMIETPVKISLYDKDGELVGLKTDMEIEFHHMKIENDVYEVDFRHLMDSVESAGELEAQEQEKFKMVFSHDNWKVIDFDNYMNGNEIVKAQVSII